MIYISKVEFITGLPFFGSYFINTVGASLNSPDNDLSNRSSQAYQPCSEIKVLIYSVLDFPCCPTTDPEVKYVRGSFSVSSNYY